MPSDKQSLHVTDGHALRLVSEQEMYAEALLNWIMFGGNRLWVFCKRHGKVALVNDLRMTLDTLSLCVDTTIKEGGQLHIATPSEIIWLGDREAFAK